MNDWGDGYTTDVSYLCECYNELNPFRFRLPFISAGVAFPEVYEACELGLGLGLSANIHATASICRWQGNDFNPSQARFAQELAKVAGTGARFVDQSFAEFCPRTDLPDFDFIGLHGVWSWISDENRKIIVDFIRRKLKVGGVLYISYNTLPGWADKAPLRHLLTAHGAILGAPGDGTVKRIDKALEFAERLMEVTPAYISSNPQVSHFFNAIKQHGRQYIAHEYFNRDWHPMYFSELAAHIAPAKVSYVCSARHLDHVDIINLTSEQKALLDSIPDITFRETVRDYIFNMQFRQDYWVKGVQKLHPLKQAELLRQERFLLVTPSDEVELHVTGYKCAGNLTEAIYRPILDSLADHTVKTAGEIEQGVKPAGVQFEQLLPALLVLMGKGDVVAAQDEAVILQARPNTSKFNLHLMEEAANQFNVRQLASPVTGGGVSLEHFHFLFLLARHQGAATPEELARFVQETLFAHGQCVVDKEGNIFDTPEKSLAELQRKAREFCEKRLPILAALQIA